MRTPRAVIVTVIAAATLTACRTGGQNAGPWSPGPTATGPAVSTAPPSADSQTKRPSAGSLRQVHDPGEVTGTIPSSCTYRDGGHLPDPSCTPGAIDPAVTQANIRSTICRSGYTKTVRPPESETERFKFDQAYPAYGVRHSTRTELDHLVSLELGGANDASNLWPQRPPTPNPKDDVENAVHHAVCSGRVTLAAAQQAIASNWTTAETRLGLR